MVTRLQKIHGEPMRQPSGTPYAESIVKNLDLDVRCIAVVPMAHRIRHGLTKSCQRVVPYFLPLWTQNTAVIQTGQD